MIVFKHVQRYVFSFFTFRRRHCRSFSGDLLDTAFLRLRLDAAGRIARNPEHPEVTGTSGYRIGIHRTSGKKFSPFKFTEGIPGDELCVSPNRLKLRVWPTKNLTLLTQILVDKCSFSELSKARARLAGGPGGPYKKLRVLQSWKARTGFRV